MGAYPGLRDGNGGARVAGAERIPGGRSCAKRHPAMELICRAEPRPARALPAQDGHLMSQGDEFEFQRGTAAHPEQEQGPEGGQKRKNADDGMTAAPETLCFLGVSEF